MSKQISWTQSGHSVTVEVFPTHFILTLDGKASRHGSIALPMPKDRAMYATRNARGNFGALVIYNDRAAELEAMQAELQAADPMTEMRRLETAMFAAMEAALNAWEFGSEAEATAFANEHQARAAFDAWVEANRELYDAEMARREAAQTSRREELLKNIDILGV